MDRCPGQGDALSAYLDGELDEAESRAVAAHLAGCPACSAEFEGLRQVKRFMAAGSPLSPVMSKDLAARVRANVYPRRSRYLGALRRPLFDLPRARLFAPALVTVLLVCALLAGMLGATLLTPSPVAAAANASLNDHVVCSKLGRVVQSLPGDAQQVSVGLREALGMNISLPTELPPGYTFAGGRTIRAGDITAAHLAWSKGATMLSFYEAADPGGDPPSTWRQVTLGDRSFWFSSGSEHAVLWRGADTIYLLVGDLPDDELLQSALSVEPSG